MYEQHFGFQGMPFSASPADWKFFESESTAVVVQKVLHSLQSASGVAVVTGPEGVGKTVLMHHLQAVLARQGQAMVLPATSLRSTEDLYIGIRRSLRTLDGQNAKGGAGRWDVVERLHSSSEFWGPIGLLVDDAHLMSDELFAELQFLLEQRNDSQTLCRLLLTGTHALEETLARPALSGFAQRIRTFGFLQPLRLAESVEYLRVRLSHVGGDLAACFEADAVEALVEAADGLPRCLDLLADESLLTAFHDGGRCATRESVQTALAGLQHLPHAWNISVSHQEDSSLDDSTTRESGWQSASDGVIEVGAAPADFVGTHAENAEAEDDFSDEPAADAGLTSDDFSEDLDELPLLQDLAGDSWLDESLPDVEADPPEPVADVTDSDDRSFEAGYLLASMESVGEPSIEIDENLDQRLLHAAGEVDDQTEDPSAAQMTPLEELLTDLDLWQPSGSWPTLPHHCDDVIRSWKMRAESARAESEERQSAEPTSAVTATVNEYSAEIPAAEEPLPVWPPDASRLGPGGTVAITEIETTRGPSPAEESLAVSEATPERVSQPPVPTREQWSDGQLLHDLQGSDAAPVLSDGDSEDKQPVPMRLRIAEQLDGAEEELADAPDDSARDHHPEPQDRMFTLPVALDEVAGDCAPLVESVRELSEELDSFHRSADDRGYPTGQMPDPQAAPSGGELSVGEQAEQCGAEEAATDDLELRRPLLISEARRLLASAAPARQLRQAAGAENSCVTDDPRPTLTVTGWNDDVETDAESAASDQAQATVQRSERNGFHNLFTRLRGQR